jgi:hypothetical protein
MLFTTRRRQDSTHAHTPLLRAPARGVDNGSGQRQNGTMANDGNGVGTGMDGEAKTTTTATSTPPLRAAARRVEEARQTRITETGQLA